MGLRAWAGGFTLIEVIMVLVLVGIISLAVSFILFQGTKSFEAMDVKKDLAEQGSLAMERMSLDLMRIRCANLGSACAPQSTDITAMAPTEIRFVNSDNSGRGFRLDAGTLKLRQGASGTDPEDMLANNVSSLTFQYLKKDGTAAAIASDVWTINVAMTLSKKTQSVDFRESIHPRLFR